MDKSLKIKVKANNRGPIPLDVVGDQQKQNNKKQQKRKKKGANPPPPNPPNKIH